MPSKKRKASTSNGDDTPGSPTKRARHKNPEKWSIADVRSFVEDQVRPNPAV